jgi:SAM-dependent methyltransferase
MHIVTHLKKVPALYNSIKRHLSMENVINDVATKGINTTRGFGLLEPFLARLRARLANQMIPDSLRDGRILDIGCGSYPYFLSHTYFKEKYAIDQLEKPKAISNINWLTLNLNQDPFIPFEDNYFSVITLLAVVEHLNPNSLVGLFKEIHRSLCQDGILVITTPAAWSDGLLRLMAKFRLVSPEEISEHVYVYTLPLLGWYFGKAGFEMSKVNFGYFESKLNLWATATK